MAIGERTANAASRACDFSFDQNKRNREISLAQQ